MSDTPNEPLRIVALTGSGAPITQSYARLVESLRKAGAEVTPIPVPKQGPSQVNDGPPVLSDLKAGIQSFANSLVSSFAGQEKEPPWLISHLRTAQDQADAVVALDPRVAARVFPVVDRVWPNAVRIGVEGDYHVAPDWNAITLDDLVVPHPTLGKELQAVQRGVTRIRAGGPLVGGEEVESKTLADDKPMVVVSFARMEAGDVDPLLFQISLAHPEDFSLLFLPAGRQGVDELVRARAGGYGLRGKRPKAGSDPEKWIRGATVLVGRPAPSEAAIAVQAGVPSLIFSTSRTLDSGDAFLVQHGAALHANLPITVAVQLESLLPGGSARLKAEGDIAKIVGEGLEGVSRSVISAAREGRGPAVNETVEAGAGHDDDLEDIGGSEPTIAAQVPTSMGKDVRRAYLSEIILQQKQIEKQLGRAQMGLETWTHRNRLAEGAGRNDLVAEAQTRVEGLKRIINRLQNQVAQLQGLRDRFAGREPLTAMDRQQASQFMSPETANMLDRQARPDQSVFAKLEIDDALNRLKNKLKGND